jgi:hypothetical protein
MTNHVSARLALLGLAASAVLFGLGAGTPVLAQEVGCETIELSFDTAGKEPRCYAGSDSGRNSGSEGGVGWSSNYEVIGLDAPELSIIMQVDRAGRYTYLNRVELREDVDVEPWFTGSRDWGDAYELEGYEVQEFEGTWEGTSGYWTCAGFARYSGYVAGGGAGYRERLSGAFCVPPGQKMPADELRQLLRSIRY